MTNALGSLRKPAQQPFRPPKSPVTKPQTTNVDANSGPTTGSSTSTTSKSDEVASESTAGNSDSNSVEPTTSVASSPSSDLSEQFNQAEVISKVIQPVANAVVTVATVALSVPGALAALPNSSDPVADVITSLQTMLTTLADAFVPLVTELPNDLIALLGIPGAVPVVTGLVGNLHSAGWFATVGVPALGSPLLPPDLPVLSAVPLSGSDTASVQLGGIGLAALRDDFAPAGTTPLATDSTTPTDLKSFLGHTVNAILLPASLSALAALALPGAAALLIACAAGVRLGYRQAMAAVAARKSGIARFAGTGPLGVVRSGSLIALHRPRATRGTRAQPQRAAGFLEQVA